MTGPSRCGHTLFSRGKRLRVVMRDGRKFDDRYVERRSGSVVFVDAGPVRTKDIRRMFIVKGAAA